MLKALIVWVLDLHCILDMLQFILHQRLDYS